MNVVKTIYEDLPETVKIPKEFIHKKAEMILLIDDKSSQKNEKKLSDFFGSIPDFPERDEQGNFEIREIV
ncbi:MAG: hypothetical protein A2X61_17135 [Ignavibacteria bacterium GWB2_35_12]|nr:MAG: hypothetical protein A2X61_17135 [Ignavibacteria bacterium GWB2_35_12]OGU94514.1 MAG: hypothetical protein A2220_01430 [Ignavibacteria bacterium RIFOXYA2_FULL_35_10]OGV19076.1 MAG: hypothetical protein A2475_07675 [Ignavibacteria bacterium RIFOXYC2_FULL_35_21]